MSTDKTLADVQLGGRVRLGDQAERARFEAWARAQSYRGGNILTDRDADHPDVYSDPLAQLTWKSWKDALSAQPSPGGQGDALELLERYDWAVSALDAELNEGWDEGGRRARLQSDRDEVRAELIAAITARQPVGEPVCSGGFVISNGSGEKYMAWGQVGPEWTADRSAALWLVRRADAEALAAENEDAWSILPVERCALPPNGWACTLAAGHEGPCPTIAVPPAQAVDLGQFRDLAEFALSSAKLHNCWEKREALARDLLALIDSQDRPNG
ncbi:hypothetical protein [Stenotrophomonas sepilia]|uniref:hypothetical protein n=1 Tax=Stenotrophomonas sepilia TaxID=2860290 RepID=UPI00333E9598